MNTIETKHKIGDLIYTANVYGIDRDVIKAIKVEGVEESISYGIKTAKGRSMFDLWYGGDGFSWYTSNQIFDNKEDAESLHNSLKAKADAKEAQQKIKDRKKRLAELKREQEALESGEDFESDDD